MTFVNMWMPHARSIASPLAASMAATSRKVKRRSGPHPG